MDVPRRDRSDAVPDARAVPVSYALADAYTTCDRWFCSVMGPTWPNRVLLARRQRRSALIETTRTLRSVDDVRRSRPDRSTTGSRTRRSTGPTTTARSRSCRCSINPARIRSISARTTAPARSASRRLRGPHRSVLQGRRRRARCRRSTYIDPSFTMNDDHPPIHPINGQELIVVGVQRARRRRRSGRTCMLVITYDENGGFFDHVSPPTRPTTTLATQGFDQLGLPRADDGDRARTRSRTTSARSVQLRPHVAR